MTIVQTVIPPNSLIKKWAPDVDYSDCFLGQFISEKPVHLESIVRYFLNHNPGWVNFLMKVRNTLVKPLGLKTDYNPQPIVHISKGSTVFMFEVLEINDEEVLLFIGDKHLDAYLSIMVSNVQKQYEITVSTTIQFRNMLGHVYFFFIKPFHILIIESMMLHMVTHFSKPIKTICNEK